MKFSFIKMGLVAACAMAAGFASAQSLDIWFNKTGNTAHPSTITVAKGGTVNLTVYYQTNGFAGSGGLSQLGALLGFGSSTTAGTGATNTDGRLTYVGGSFAYAAPFSGFDVMNGLAGGSGPASGTARSYGYFADTFALGTIANTDDTPQPFYSVSIKVDSSVPIGTSIPVTIYADTVDANPGAFSPYGYAGNTAVKGQAFTANIVVASGATISPKRPVIGDDDGNGR